MPRYLFVITRDLIADASAAYLLRVAAATARRDGDVVLYLMESAICHSSLEACQTMLGQARAAGARVLVDAALCQQVGSEIIDATAVSDAHLADLLLAPGVRAHWC